MGVSNLNTKARAEIGGHRETELGTYSGASPLGLASQVREAHGLAPLEISTYDPVTDPPNPHPREPFEDPRNVDPLANFDPLKRAPVFNPRSDEVPADVEFTKDDFDVLALDRNEPSLEEIRGVVSRYESRLEGDLSEAPTDPLRESYETEMSDSQFPGQSLLEEYSTEDDTDTFRAETPLVTFARKYTSFVEETETRLTHLWTAGTDRSFLPDSESTLKRGAVALPLAVLAFTATAVGVRSGILSTGSTSSDLFALIVAAYANTS